MFKFHLNIRRLNFNSGPSTLVVNSNKNFVKNINLIAINKKRFFGLYSSLKKSVYSSGELIIHPDYEDKLPKDNSINENSQRIHKNISQQNDSSNLNDDPMSFIKYDKNNIPIIISNYYESLGINEKSSSREIKINFLKIAKKFHPDKNPEALVNNLN